MTLRERFLDAIIDGKLGKGIIVTRQEFMRFFSSDNSATIGVFLSNSEIKTGVLHRPTYKHFTERVEEGKYRIHPQVLQQRMQHRGLL